MTPDHEVLIVGAGISGIGAGIELLRRSNPSFLIIDAESEPGGTWRDNTYPGVAVDIASPSYCYAYETDYPWSRLFAPGAEIREYVQHCARKYAVLPHIRCHARAICARFDESSHTWATELDDGSTITSRFLISATGLLSQPKHPAIGGLDAFTGRTFHTARWDHGHDLGGCRVAVIGTGASAVQVVPEIASCAAELRVFQRTPIWVSPRLDLALAPASRSLRRFRVIRSALRFASESALEIVTFFLVNYRRFPWFVRIVQSVVRAWMLRQVRDAETAQALVPAYGLGCKRPTTSNTYLATFNRKNVQLVTRPVERICADGIITTDGALHEVDTIILATGFLTTEKGNAPSFDVFGTAGVELGQFWSDQQLQCYGGVSVPGYPNFFLTAGPYSGGFNWFTMLAAHLDHIMGCIDEAHRRGATRAEVGQQQHEDYMSHMRRRAEGTVFKDASCSSARSYYIDRHGNASLPLPHTPWWRVAWLRRNKLHGYTFTRPDARVGLAV